MNKRDVLFIRPSDCRYCFNGFYGLGHVVNYAASKSFNLTDLQSTFADNPYIDDTVNDFDPYMIYGFGHGNVNVYTANSETPVWHTGETLPHLAGRIIYLLSCLTANQLGPHLIDEGALGYGGFLISWTWMTNDVNGDPYDDEYAEGFYKSTNKFFESLLDGNTLAQAMQDSIDEYNYWIQYWTDIGDSDVVKWLIHDRDGLVIYGDPTASTVSCEDFDNRQDCLDAGCWWINGECTCNPPPVVATYDFTIEATPSEARINVYDSWYPIGYRLSEDNYSWVDYNIRVENVGAGYSSIFTKIVDQNGDKLWSRSSSLNPGQIEKRQCRVNTSKINSIHTLIAGHIHEGESVVDDESTISFDVEFAKKTDNCPWPTGYTKLGQRECRDNIIGVKFTQPEDGNAVGIEFFSLVTHFLPDPKIRCALYKVSDGSLIAEGTKEHSFTGMIARHRIHFGAPVSLNAGEEYWAVVQKGDDIFGHQLLQKTDGALGIGARMEYDPTSPLPNTFVPGPAEDECYIWCIYQ